MSEPLRFREKIERWIYTLIWCDRLGRRRWFHYWSWCQNRHRGCTV